MSPYNFIAFLPLCLCMHLLVLCNGRHLSHLAEENKVGMKNVNDVLGHVKMGIPTIEISETSSFSSKPVGEEKDGGQEIKLDGYSTKAYESQVGATAIISRYLKNPMNIFGNFISGKRSGSTSHLGHQQELEPSKLREVVQEAGSFIEKAIDDRYRVHNNISVSMNSLGFQFQMQTRSMLEHAPRKEVEETINPKENDVDEDAVVMDYAQPHRKPPIHNEEH